MRIPWLPLLLLIALSGPARAGLLDYGKSGTEGFPGNVDWWHAAAITGGAWLALQILFPQAIVARLAVAAVGAIAGHMLYNWFHPPEAPGQEHGLLGVPMQH